MLTANTKISSIWMCMWLRSRVVLYRTEVQGMTISQERGTEQIPLSAKLDKSRLIISKQTAKINLKRCNKMMEECQQPKGRKERHQIPQKQKIKAWQTHRLWKKKNAEKVKLLRRNWKVNRLTDCQRKTKVSGVRSFLLIGTDNHSSESQEAVWQNQEIKLTVWDNFST